MPGGLYPPPSVIASWPKPNYIDPETQGNALTYVCIIFSALSLLIVAARFYSRVFITKALGADDFFAAISLCFSIALSVFIIIQEKIWYTGHHVWDIPVAKFVGSRLTTWILEWCYLAAICSVKISILLFYRRLSVTFSKTFFMATWAGIVYNVLYMVAFMLPLLLDFKPIQAYWLSFDPVWATTHKWSKEANEAISLPLSGAFSVLGDFYSTALPLLLVHYLDMPRRQKNALYSLFALGFLVVAAGIVRTILLDRVVNKTYDVNWELWTMWIWTVIELNVAILAASAPALKPFLRRFLINPIVSSWPRTSDPAKGKKIGDGSERGPFRRLGWSNYSSSAQDSKVPDVEKIGIALGRPEIAALENEGDDGHETKRYRLGSIGGGKKLVPVELVHEIRQQQSFDTTTEVSQVGSADHILSTNGSRDYSTELRPYRIDIAPPLPSEQKSFRHVRSFDDYNDPTYTRPSTGGSARSPTPNFSNPRATRAGEVGNPPRTQSSGMHDLPENFPQTPSQASLRAARARAQQMQQRSDRDLSSHTHSRSLSQSSERNFSLPSTAPVEGRPYQELEELQERSSSEETLELPRQGSREMMWEVHMAGDRAKHGVGYAV